MLIPITVYATHQGTTCNISVNGQLFPVLYNDEARSNPDNSFYPGDGFHFLFKYRGSDTCGGFGAEPLKSGGTFTVLSHDSITDYKQSGHSHHDMNSMVKKLKVTSYYEVLDADTKCKVFRGGLRSCTTNYTLSDNPVFSFREDHELSKSDGKKISYYSKNNGKYQESFSEEWGIIRIKENHSHGDTHQFEDSSSINSFEKQIQSYCSGLAKFEGCVFGHAEISTEPDLELCLYEELEKLGINTDEIKTPDVCVYDQNQLNLTVKGTRIVCSFDDKGREVCKPIKVSNSYNLAPNVLETDFEIILEKPALRDSDNYAAKNIAGNYYLDDPITISHEPSLQWKEFRSNSIQFETTKQYNLKKELEFDCKENNCIYTVNKNGLYQTIHELINGKGMTVYNATSNDEFGFHDFHYRTIVTNLDRFIGESESSIKAEVVTYDPKYKCHPYPLLKDEKEYAFDDRYATVCHYFGNDRNGIIHTQERSKLNSFYNVGVGYDPYIPQVIHSDFQLSEGHNSSEHISLESHNRTAMFIQEGYGRLYFDYPLGDIVLADDVPRYENVTSFTTLYSENFASKDSILDHYSMRYPEAPFTNFFVIKSVNQNGEIIDDFIELEITPYEKIGAEYIQEYIFDKIKFDTNDENFANIISNDTYPMTQKYSSTGILNVTISKTSVFFEEYVLQNNDVTSPFSNKLTDITRLADTPEKIRILAPYDIGLSTISPTTITITVNDVSYTMNERYFSFGSKQTMIINTQTDNVLDADRSIGKIIVYLPKNFGLINAVYVDDKIVKQACQSGCILLFQSEKEITLSVHNKWGGIASTVLSKVELPSIPISDEPDYMVILAISMALIMIYIVYKKVRLN